MSNFKLHTGGGDHFESVAKKAKQIAEERKLVVEFDFNDVTCLVDSNTVLDWLYSNYCDAHIMEWKTIGPNCPHEYDIDTQIELYSRKLQRAKDRKKAFKEMEKKDKSDKFKVDQLVKGLDLKIIPGKEAEYLSYVAKNSNDGYSRGVVDYAEYWGKLMQIEILKGNAVAEVAEATQKHLSFIGIAGFMYGCAVSALAHFWVHGEELRKWHNKEYGVKDDKGGVVNPAIFTIG